jgi:hypothetical protein
MMRTLSKVVVLSTGTALGFPTLGTAQGCDDGLRSCLSGTILFQPAETWDFAGCNYEYAACLRDAIVTY